MLADAAKAAKYPTLPRHAHVKARYEDRTANGLTRAVVDWMTLQGHFATRLDSTGTYRADLSRYIPSQQRKGMPDVFDMVNDRAVFVEVKVGRNHLSNDQKVAIADLKRAGAAVYIDQNFQGFFDWFNGPIQPPFV